MHFFIGIDAGGTKTNAVLCDENANVIKHVVGPGCNPMDAGLERTEAIICSCAELLTENPEYRISALYAAIAGMNHVKSNLDTRLKQLCPVERVGIDDDRRIVVSSTLGHSEGCGLICGTGCSLSIIKNKRPISQIGGYGYLIDTGGSGFEIGQAALRHAFRYLDGRGPETALVDLIQERTGKSLEEGFADIYVGGRSYIASLASCVFHGSENGDRVCQDILKKGSDDLAELTFAAEKQFDDKFTIVMTGGIFFAYPYYAEMVRSKSSKKAHMIPATAEPVYGAIVEAEYLSGLNLSDAGKENFKSTYESVPIERIK